MPIAKILVSACLLGRPVRYDGAARTLRNDVIGEWQAEGRVVAICPELAAGLGVPRPAAEIGGKASGEHVTAGQARVVTASNADLTAQFIAGARAAVELAMTEGCQFALLVDGSPSCGSSFVYDGSFTGNRHAGQGVTAALLRANGVAVFSEARIDALAEAIRDHES